MDDSQKRDCRKLAKRLDESEGLLVIELPKSGTRRMHSLLNISDETLIVKALQECAER